MKKFSTLLAVFAFVFAMAGFVIALVNFFERRRDLFCCDDEDYGDELFEANPDYYAKSVPDLSPEAEGNTAPVDNADPPADASPQEH